MSSLGDCTSPAAGIPGRWAPDLAGRGPRDARDAHSLRFELVPWLKVGASGAVGGAPLVCPLLPTAGRRRRAWAVRRRWGELREGKERGRSRQVVLAGARSGVHCGGGGYGARRTDAGSARARLTTERRGKREDRVGSQGKVTRLRGQLDRLHARGVSRHRCVAARGHARPPRRRCGLPGRGVQLHGVRSHLRRGWVHSGVAQTSVRRTPPRAPRGQQLGAGALCARARRGRRRCQFLFHLRRFKHT
jgi:hypothetical protein